MNISRRNARIAALQTLYELDATAHPVTDVLARNLEEPLTERADAEAGVGERLEPEAQAFAGELVAGVLGRRDELDRIIETSAPNWPIDQMSRIDKAILRLAIFEVLFHNRVPLKAAINEAVELAKRFGSDSSSRFINGVLGTVAQGAPPQGSRGRATSPEAEPPAEEIDGEQPTTEPEQTADEAS
jgi:transcription antitermination protein NusB